MADEVHKLTRTQIQSSIESANKIASRVANRLKDQSEESQSRIIGEGVSDVTLEVSKSSVNLSPSDKNLLALSTLFTYDSAIDTYMGEGIVSGEGSDSENSWDGSAAGGIDAILTMLGLGDLAYVADLVTLVDKIRKIPDVLKTLGTAALTKIGPMLPYAAVAAIAVGGAIAIDKISKAADDMMNALDERNARIRAGEGTEEDLESWSSNTEGGVGTYDDRDPTVADVKNGAVTWAQLFASIFTQSDFDKNITLNKELMELAETDVGEYRAISNTTTALTNELLDFDESELLANLNNIKSSYKFEELPEWDHKIGPFENLKEFVYTYCVLKANMAQTSIKGEMKQIYQDVITSLINQVGQTQWKLNTSNNDLGMAAQDYYDFYGYRWFHDEYYYLIRGYFTTTETVTYGWRNKKSKEIPVERKDSELSKYMIPSYVYGQSRGIDTYYIYDSNWGDFDLQLDALNRDVKYYWFDGDFGEVYEQINRLARAKIMSGRTDQSNIKYQQASIELFETNEGFLGSLQEQIEKYGFKNVVRMQNSVAVDNAFKGSGATGVEGGVTDGYSLLTFLERLGLTNENGDINMEALENEVNNWSGNFRQASMNAGLDKGEWNDIINELKNSEYYNRTAGLVSSGRNFGDINDFIYGTEGFTEEDWERVISNSLETDYFKNSLGELFDQSEATREEIKELMDVLPQAIAASMTGDTGPLTQLMAQGEETARLVIAVANSLGNEVTISPDSEMGDSIYGNDYEL